MGDLRPKDRLQPSLIDRLTDDDPTSSVESGDLRFFTAEKMRESVRRDLTALLNSTHFAAVCDLRAYPEVERSTVNYGIADLVGRSASTIDKTALTRMIRKAIVAFEPRLDGSSLKVRLVTDPDRFDPNALRFDIEANLWQKPLPIRLHLRTDLNLEDGDVRVTEVSAG